MRWVAGGILYACAALYILVNLLGAVMAMLVHLIMLIGLALIGKFLVKSVASIIKKSDDEGQTDKHE